MQVSHNALLHRSCSRADIGVPVVSLLAVNSAATMIAAWFVYFDYLSESSAVDCTDFGQSNGWSVAPWLAPNGAGGFQGGGTLRVRF